LRARVLYLIRFPSSLLSLAGASPLLPWPTAGMANHSGTPR
jgi:hypothetical protein